MHRLLKRQIKKLLQVPPDSLPPEFQRFLDDVSEAYENGDRERALLEHVQDMNAQEINVYKEKEGELALMRSKMAMLESFSRFVPRQFLHILGKDDLMAVEVGEAVQHRMTILFTDIRSFTSLSERMDVEENFRFLNSYMQVMGPLIHEQGGFIDKYIGDAIMALFPPGGADNALKATIEMWRELGRYNEGRVRAGYVAIDIGIGLNTGDLMLGTVGSPSRMDTTVIGDAVNLAARIESTTKSMGAKVLLSGYTVDELLSPDQFHLRRVGRVRVAGKEQPVEVFELLDADPPELAARKWDALREFSAGLEDYERGSFESAGERLRGYLDQIPEDAVATSILGRCERMQAAPRAEWDGVFDVRK